MEYRPLVGTQTAGAVAIGMDWSATEVTVEGDRLVRVGAAPTRDKALACTPCVDTAVWQRVPSMILPGDKLRQKAWYSLTKAAAIDAAGYVDVVPTTTDTVGEVWLHYTVELAGTRTS